MIKINLLGDTLSQAGGKRQEKSEQVQQVYAQEEGARRSSLPIAGLLVGLLLASGGVVYYLVLNHKIVKAEERRAALEKEKQELERYTKQYERYQKQKEELQKKLALIRELKVKQELPVHLMEEIANCVPDDVWMESLLQQGKGITIKGESGSFEAINQFRSRLQENKKWFRNVSHTESTRKASKTIDFVVTFEMVVPS